MRNACELTEQNGCRGKHIASRSTLSQFADAIRDSTQDFAWPSLVERSPGRRPRERGKGLSLVCRPVVNRGRLLLEPRIPTGHSSLGCWCPLSTGNGCAGTGHASGSGPGLFTSGPTLIRGPGLDRSVRTSAPPLEGQDPHPHPFGFPRHGFRDYHDAVCSRCGSSRDCKSVSPQLCWRGTHAPDLDVAVATGHCVHVRLPGGNRNGSNCSPSIPLVVLLRGLLAIVRHPALLHHWGLNLSVYGDRTAIFVASAQIFPQLALGLSGFETGVSVMPLIANRDSASQEADTGSPPLGRIRVTGKLLLTAAVIMSCMLLLSSFVATLLIPESDYPPGAPASGRARPYLAHGLLGNEFGAVYDLSTILILWFAGASAMTGLLNLIPRYLPRFGMAPRWVAYRRPLVLVLLAINVAVTLAFRAQVEAQAGAYATGVLVLMCSGAAGVALDLWRESSLRKPQTMLVALYFFVITLVFAYTLGANIVERPDGLIVATIFIILLLAASAISWYARSSAMRVPAATYT